MSPTGEASVSFACFGAGCWLHVDGREPDAHRAAASGRRRLLAWHDRFTRFSPFSELSLLNSDPRAQIPATPIMRRFAQAVVDAGRLTDGLVDGGLLDELEAAGYAGDLGPAIPVAQALSLAPARRPAAPREAAAWRSLSVDRELGVVRRPPGLRLDSGGLAKGMFADVLATRLAVHRSFAVECAGDVRLGGTGGVPRPVHVESPFDGSVLHTFELTDAGIATSGIGRRSWMDPLGRPAHHLLDPSTGRPAFTGVVQATALAPTALEAEVRAKAAVLSGPEHGIDWLPHGGVLVLDDESVRVVAERSSIAGVPG